MKKMNNQPSLVTQVSLQEYFYDSLSMAIEHQHQSFNAETVFYITNMLTQFSDSDVLFEETENGKQIQPLAFLYGRAVAAKYQSERDLSLKYLGDIALFISGLYSDSLNRSLIDIDYYIGMGESAYSSLAQIFSSHTHSVVFHIIYDELSKNFLAVVDILQEVASEMHTHSNDDILRLYEIWIRTRSKQAELKLRSLGIEPHSSTQINYH